MDVWVCDARMQRMFCRLLPQQQQQQHKGRQREKQQQNEGKLWKKGDGKKLPAR